VEVDEGKRHPLDFVLWFTRSKFEHQAMLWDSPWGRGYPGWHIECSAMSMKYLGEQFDIHCGGVDHIPIHHTNEIAQSEAATGKPWVSYWLHGEFLLMGKEKMAKSAGRFVRLADLTDKGYEPLDYRCFCLGAHYRTQLAFSPEALDAARTARLGLVERIVQLKREAGQPLPPPDGKAGEYLAAFGEHAAEDLNMPKCLADLWTLMRDTSVDAGRKLSAALQMDRVLGLDLAGAEEREVSLDAETRRLIKERELARGRREWKKADEIRDLLAARGILLQDGAGGTTVRIAAGKRDEKAVTSDGNSC
jgi:cysteinyl-tRNA synthetase